MSYICIKDKKNSDDMIKSMTGFGKVICELPDKTITIEIRSLNSKQLDVISKLPSDYKEKEPEIRNIISNKLSKLF